MALNPTKTLDKKILDVRELTTEFQIETHSVTAVDDCSFYLNTGETLGIVGESGSGKSVTALSIMHLIKPPGKIDKGTIFYFGNDQHQDLLKLSKKEKIKYRGKDISMIFQEPMTSLNPVFKCGEQVLESILLHEKISRKAAIEKVYTLFSKVALPDPERIYHAYPHEISGGQKQRVMIAMAISCRPKILIADEPTTALDVTVQNKIIQLLKSLQSEIGLSIIFITHDLGVLANIANRVLVMYQGKIVESNTIQNIFKQPKHPYTKSLIACRPPLDRQLSRLPIAEDFLEKTQDENGQTKLIAKNVEVKDLYQQWTIKKVENTIHREKLISVHELSTYYPVKANFWGKTTQHIKAVDSVSFDIHEGEILGLVGESGCGKTTLGRSILKLLKPNAGTVIYQGIDILSLQANQMKAIRKDLQIIFQDPYASLNPRMTVGQAIMEPMLFHGLAQNKQEAQEKAMELLESVQLEAKHFGRFPSAFSGGQRQRICIARALSVSPKFIVCDECVSALDVSVQASIINLLLHLREKYQLSYLFISHDLSVVKFMSDRIMVMNEGKIIEQGTPERIYQSPKTDYTKQLIAAIPKIP